ncbi:MAG: ATP-binding protein [Phycisphaerales bacterium]|nr:ATP-binding protein [Phycisphaerales bacterium]
MAEGDTIRRSTGEPLGFIAVSRRVLHLANRGPGRIEFLRDVSRLLLDLSGCESLELRACLARDEPQFIWSAKRHPSETFDFQVLAATPASGQPASLPADRAPWLEELIQSVIRGDVGRKSRNITQRGSFWTGDAVAELALRAGKDAGLAGKTDPFESLAIILFEVAPAAPAVLVLLSKRKYLFTAQNIELYEAMAQTLGLAVDDRRAQHALRERVKELTCLYSIAQIIENANGSITESLGEIVRLLPPAWQFPMAVVARIRLGDLEFAIGDFGRAIRRQEAPMIVDGVRRGVVEVGYAEDRPDFVEGAFLKEEENLIVAVAREVSLFIQRCEAQGEKERLAEQLRQADRLATIGQLAAGIAHEINEPLGSILGFAQLARKAQGLAEKVGEDLDKIILAALHAREIVRKLMLFARQSPPVRSSVKMNEVVEGCLALLTTQFTQHRVEVIRDLDPAPGTIFGDAVQLHQVVVNLCVNAIQAMPRGGTMTVRTRAEADALLLVIEDTGAGMPPDVAERVFQPFFTTKSPEEGTGLGLSVVHGIVLSHGGAIRFDTKPGAGTRFEVRFPTASPARGTPSNGSNG